MVAVGVVVVVGVAVVVGVVVVVGVGVSAMKSNQLIEAAKAELEVVNERLRIADQIRSMLMRADMPGGTEGTALELLATELNGLERGLRANPPTAQPDEQAWTQEEIDTAKERAKEIVAIIGPSNEQVCITCGGTGVAGDHPTGGYTEPCRVCQPVPPSEGEVAAEEPRFFEQGFWIHDREDGPGSMARLAVDHPTQRSLVIDALNSLAANTPPDDGLGPIDWNLRRESDGSISIYRDHKFVAKAGNNLTPDGHVAVYLPVEEVVSQIANGTYFPMPDVITEACRTALGVE